MSTAKRRLVIGLDKLETTEVEVDELKRDLEEMQPVRIATSKDVEVMMEQIEKDKAEADKTREVVMKEEEIKESAEKWVRCTDSHAFHCKLPTCLPNMR